MMATMPPYEGRMYVTIGSKTWLVCECKHLQLKRQGKVHVTSYMEWQRVVDVPPIARYYSPHILVMFCGTLCGDNGVTPMY